MSDGVGAGFGVDARGEVDLGVGPAVVAFVPDLMDRSKVRSGFPDAELVPAPAKLADAVARAGGATGRPVLVLVDLGRPGAFDAVRGLGAAPGRRVVGFASHVDEAALAAARDAGVEAVPRSVFFRRLHRGELVAGDASTVPGDPPGSASPRSLRFDVDSTARPRASTSLDSPEPRSQRFDVDSTEAPPHSPGSPGGAGRLAPREQRALLERAAALAADHLERLDERPVASSGGVDELRRALGGPLPDGPADPLRTVEALVSAAAGGLVASNGPRYFGFVTGGSLPAALAADWLTSAWDQNVALGVMSPAAAVAEEVVGAWLADLLGLPPTVSFGLVTGAQMANVVGLASARRHTLARLGVDVDRVGLAGAPPLRVVVGAERHVTVDVALRYLGVGTDQVTVVPADEEGRMRPDALDAALDRLGEGPTIVCAQAGCVSTGAFDPFEAIVAACHREDRRAWVHVDGAFGLWAAASPRHRASTSGLAGADSWATDGHKWLNVPYDAGFAFVAHPDDHRASMAMQAAYLQRGDAPDGAALRDGSDWAPESSRRARAFPTWAALRSLGRRGVAELVERDCRLATRLASGLAVLPGVEVRNEVVLNQVLVTFGDDARTAAVTAAVQAAGEAWFGGTTWAGRTAARISISGWSTTEADVDRLVAAIAAALAAPEPPSTPAGR